VDQLRDESRRLEATADGASPAPGTIQERTVVLLAATDPANPYGAALAWPPAPVVEDGPGDRPAGQPTAGRHRPGRKAGAVVVLVDGSLVLYLEKGGRSLLSFTADEGMLAAAAGMLAAVVAGGRLGRLTLARADGAELLAGGATASPLARALVGAGFGPTPRGLRLRGQR
jgi:ATP-dependent Lhr-like helicase